MGRQQGVFSVSYASTARVNLSIVLAGRHATGIVRHRLRRVTNSPPQPCPKIHTHEKAKKSALKPGEEDQLEPEHTGPTAEQLAARDTRGAAMGQVRGAGRYEKRDLRPG